VGQRDVSFAGLAWHVPNNGHGRYTVLGTLAARVERSATLPTCLVGAGGARDPSIVEKSTEQLTALALRTVERHMGVRAAPDAVVAGVHTHCIPQYVVGHNAVVQRVRDETAAVFGPRLCLVGNSFDGIGASDCVVNSTKAANALADVAGL
jgi:protoporphyrinogen oxidase